MQTKMKAIINSSSEDAFDFVGYDGEYFALFGGEEGDYEYQVSLSVIFPEAATHLSFFVSVLSLGFDATSGSSFVLLIDDVSAFAIDEGNFNNYVSDPKSAPRYYPVDIDVRNYADGRMHTIVFVHWQYVTDEGCPSIVFLDFVNFLSKPSGKKKKAHISCTLPHLKYMLFSLFSDRQQRRV